MSHSLEMTDGPDEITVAYVAALQRLGGSSTLRHACDVIGSITDLDPTERSLRPVMEELISSRKLEHLGADKAAIPLRNVHPDLPTFTAASEWARGWLEGTISE